MPEPAPFPPPPVPVQPPAAVAEGISALRPACAAWLHDLTPAQNGGHAAFTCQAAMNDVPAIPNMLSFGIIFGVVGGFALKYTFGAICRRGVGFVLGGRVGSELEYVGAAFGGAGLGAFVLLVSIFLRMAQHPFDDAPIGFPGLLPAMLVGGGLALAARLVVQSVVGLGEVWRERRRSAADAG